MRRLSTLVAVAVVVVGLRSWADVAECYPVPPADIELYSQWGERQDPELVWHSCARQCVKGLRLCKFLELYSLDRARMATCNGRDTSKPPCQLMP